MWTYRIMDDEDKFGIPPAWRSYAVYAVFRGLKLSRVMPSRRGAIAICRRKNRA